MAYGYRIKHSQSLNREIDEGHAAIVRRIFDDYASGQSPRKIASSLNEEGIPSPSGGKWNDSTIRGNAKKRDGMLRNEAYIGIIVYGRNRFRRDPDTGNRISRPAAAEDIIYCEEPGLQIVDDHIWNVVQDRLDETTQKYSRKSTPLNKSHRATYLLSRLIKCECCGDSYTVVAQERYGCSTRKTKGLSVCSNTKTITKQKIEARVLARLRAGLLAPEMAGRFASEVRSLLEAEAQQLAPDKMQLEADLIKVNRAIERILDRLETDELGDALVDRLRAREAERARIRNALEDAEAARHPISLPTVKDLEQIYAGQVKRLESLLAGSNQMVEANALIGELVGCVYVAPDPDAQDGLRITIRSSAARCFLSEGGGLNAKGLPKEAYLECSKISVVAGGCNRRILPKLRCNV
ncbi:recombinase family protein [Puniceibacterium sediminis]|uniref:Recombinase zinc beta ribbon domain-containing protein n=1 Tax=Puniceibacterium sediminis TaxID=1608407 RepID=A0A238WCT1_9RHOB|nr:recombinase family protein [Puniceibacterium sediminis]SNR44386.1 Recombinase zinc beta ribbon domain-containing protein [Puniceibacterium sediminis]